MSVVVHSLNYAEQFSPVLLPIMVQEALTSPFIVPNVKWLGGRTFHFTKCQLLATKPRKNWWMESW